MTKIDDILIFWFGELKSDSDFHKDKYDIWFKKNPETDSSIRQNFEADVIQAGQGDLDAWCLTPRGALALIILLDQFTRNIYRDHPQAFAYDHKSREICLKALELGFDQKLKPIERVFLYMPLEHSEDPKLHELCLQKYQELLNDCPSGQEQDYQNFLDYAKRHADIIRRFGRYPHRNKILRRKSTPQEIEFLKQPGSSF